MFRDGINFGIDTNSGVPYVSTCRGTFEFESVENAAGFVAARSLARLTAYKGCWDTFEDDVERWHASRNGAGDEPPF